MPGPRRCQLLCQALQGTHGKTGPRGCSSALEKFHFSLGRRDGNKTMAGGGGCWAERLRSVLSVLSAQQRLTAWRAGSSSAQAAAQWLPMEDTCADRCLLGTSGAVWKVGIPWLSSREPALVLARATRRSPAEILANPQKNPRAPPSTPASSTSPVLTRNGQ